MPALTLKETLAAVLVLPLTFWVSVSVTVLGLLMVKETLTGRFLVRVCELSLPLLRAAGVGLVGFVVVVVGGGGDDQQRAEQRREQREGLTGHGQARLLGGGGLPGEVLVSYVERARRMNRSRCAIASWSCCESHRRSATRPSPRPSGEDEAAGVAVSFPALVIGTGGAGLVPQMGEITPAWRNLGRALRCPD